MNIQSKSPRSSNFNWKRIAIIAVVLGVAAFKYFNKNNQRDAAPQDRGRQSGGTAQLDLPDEIDLDSDLKRNGQSSKPDLKFNPDQQSLKSSPTKSANNSGRPYLKDGQRGKKVSPAGLVYNSSRSGEHRTEHVLRHAKDMPSRPGNHGVFDADGDDVFRLLDEAYELIQSNSRQVSKDRPRAGEEYKTAYTINMNRRIGYRGGKSGNRDGKPAVTKIKIVIANGDQVITAYPL